MPTLDWSTGYPSTRVPVFARHVVATSHPLAAQAGLSMMQRGGNAIDAAIAAAAAMTIVEPCSNGLGSDAFAIVWDGHRLHGLNASGRSPAGWTRDRFVSRYGASAPQPPRRGWDSVTVPGAVSAWAALSERFGLLPFADLLAPAIDIAERGYAVPVIVQRKWAAAAALAELSSQPGFAEAFLPFGRAPSVGERFAFPAAARALRSIAATRGEAFYRGEIAQAIAAHAAAQGGAMSLADLAAHAPEWVAPISQAWRDVEVHELPPNGQGLAALIALGLLDRLDLRGVAASAAAEGEGGVDGAAVAHLQVEAMKLAFADAYAHVADPSCLRVTPAELLSPAYLDERVRLIDPSRAKDPGPGLPPPGGTIYLTTADAEGRMVSFIQSNYMGFGSGVVIPGWGISMQNRGHGFSLDPSHCNVVAPGKRPFHTIIPAFVTRGGRPWMSFGVMGGHLQPQGHVQALVRMVDFAQSPQAACDAPRWRVDGGGVLAMEPHWPAATLAGLARRGHVLRDPRVDPQDFGAGQFIVRLGDDPAVDGYAAASDPRRDGAAVGF